MKFFVTTPIYYVNAPPHIGSAYTTIAADVLARYHRQHGADIFFLTGTAEHGTKMAQHAAAGNQTPQAFVDKNAAYFQAAWHKLNIEYTDFIRTTEPRHARAVALFFERLKASGQIYEGEYEGLYCVGHEAFLKQSELDASGQCPDHQTVPQRITEKNWFFRLSAYTGTLKERITSSAFEIAPESRRHEVLAFIEQGLEDISISRQNVEWALPLPWDETQTIYVWLDELFNYCSAIGYGADEEKFRRYWPADLHLIGKDIIKFHCIIWPALLLAINEPLPKKVFAHGYFTVNGQKMSKTLGNIVDPLKVAAEYGVDALRYFLLRDIPFGSDGDFSHDRLRERYNADLANGLGNLVSRVLNMMEQSDFSPPGVYPPNWREGGVPAAEAAGEGVNLLARVNSHLANLAFDKALAAIWQAISAADELIEQKKPWQLAKSSAPPAAPAEALREGRDKGELEGVLSHLYITLTRINQALAPFMPDTHQKLTTLLAARPLKKPAVPLFARK